MPISITEDIRPITDLKRNSQEILSHIHATKRPVVLTVNGRTDAVLLDAKVYEEMAKAFELSKMLSVAEDDINQGRIRSAKSFFKEFKNAKNI